MICLLMGNQSSPRLQLAMQDCPFYGVMSLIFKKNLFLICKRTGMNKRVYNIIVFGALACVAMAGSVFEDFESYSVGSITSPWVVTGGSPTIGLESGGNQYLESYGCYAPLSKLAIADTDTETTVFFRVCVQEGSDPDCSVGLSYLEEPTGDWNNFEAYVGLVGGAMVARSDGSNYTIFSSVTEGVWYNVWMVLNNSANTYDIYVTTGSDNATTSGAQVADDFGFRNDQGDLLAFKIYGRDWAAIRVDDIAVTTGCDLMIPSQEYGVDSDTLHLYHFVDGTDEVGSFDIAVYDGAAIEYGVLNTYDGGANSTGYICGKAGSYTTSTTLGEFMGADGSFTYEAMVKPMMEPGTAGNQEIICCESESWNATARGFQFRIQSDGTTLRFQKLSGTSDAYDATISYEAGNWYHAAVTFDATSGELKLYWTLAGEAIDLAGSWTGVTAMSSSTSTLFCIGNELRSYGDYGNENFEGWIDEVRISGIARDASEMLTGAGVPSPVITAEPVGLSVDDGDDVSLSVSFESQSTPSVEWYMVDESGDNLMNPADVTTSYDGTEEIYTSVLTLSGVDTTDAGEYYCVITNASGNPRSSATADVVVYGLVAHWTLDSANYGGGYYSEEIHGYDAEVSGLVSFTDGADGTSNGAAIISTLGGWAKCPEIDPMEKSGKMTISYWANWYESSVTEQDIVVGLAGEYSVTAADGLESDKHWQHICTVFDGETCKLYVDGVLAGESACSIPTDSAGTVMNIGTDADAESMFAGAMDDLRLYNYAMTSEEVADIRYDFSGEQSCILEFNSAYDLSGPNGESDCVIDLYDLIAFAGDWLGGSENYTIDEFSDLAETWQTDGLYPTE